MADARPGDRPQAGGDEAQIIPIGTSGRPGRGTGRTRPSSAARQLAPGRPARAPQPPPEPASSTSPTGSTSPASPVVEPASAAPLKKTRKTQRRTTPRSQPIAVSDGAPQEEPAATSSVFTQDRDETADVSSPFAGVPVGDWWAAVKHGAAEVFGDAWEPRLAEFLSFLRHRLNGRYTVDEYGFDAELTQRFFLAVLRPIADKWFRVEVRGAENIPEVGGALVVSNHSGTVPVDGLMAMVSTYDATGRHLRPLAADLVFQLPIVSSMARKGGATLACQPDAERMLRNGELVAVWPEGFKGIGKPFSERYKLQRFGRGGFVSAALRTGVPIVPLSVVGAEEIYPLVGNIPSLARLLGLPYIPITPFFPLLGPLGLIPLPSKWLLQFGEPIRTDAYDEAEAEDPMLLFEITDQVRESIQQSLYSLLRDRPGVFG